MIDLNKAGIPPMYQTASLSDAYSKRSAGQRSAIQDFIEADVKGLYFFGRNGAGKTFTGCALLLYLIRTRVQVYRTEFLHLVQMYIDNGWRMPAKVLQPSVVFIDELGKDIPTKADISVPILESLLRSRFEAGARVVLAANVNLTELRNLYGASVASLISGYCPGIEFDSADARLLQEV